MPHLFYFQVPSVFIYLVTHLSYATQDSPDPDIIHESKLDELMEMLANQPAMM